MNIELWTCMPFTNLHLPNLIYIIIVKKNSEYSITITIPFDYIPRKINLFHNNIMLAPPKISKGFRSPSPQLHRRRLSSYELQTGEAQTKPQWSDEVK